MPMVICTVNSVHTPNDSSEIRPRSIAVTVVGLADAYYHHVLRKPTRKVSLRRKLAVSRHPAGS